MVKSREIAQVWAHGRLHAGLMVYTTLMVIFTDFRTGALSAMVIHGLLRRFRETPVPQEATA